MSSTSVPPHRPGTRPSPSPRRRTLAAAVVAAVALVSVVVPLPATPPHAAAAPGGRVPDRVYRFDQRSPEEIFASGFQPWGADDNLVAHLLTESTANRTTAFVSTTELPQIAQHFSTFEGGRAGWVYTIQPDDSFYSVTTSLEAAASEGDAEVAAWVDNMTTFKETREWVSLGIDPENIVSAAPTDPVRAEPDWLRAQRNEAFAPGDPPTGEAWSMPREHWDALAPCYRERLGSFPTVTTRSARASECRLPETAEDLAAAHGEAFTGELEEIRFTLDPAHLGTDDLLHAPLRTTNQVLDDVAVDVAGLERLGTALRDSVPADLAELEAMTQHAGLAARSVEAATGEARQLVSELVPFIGIAATGWALEQDIASEDWVDASFDGVALALQAVMEVAPEAAVFVEPVLLVEVVVQLAVDAILGVFGGGHHDRPTVPAWEAERMREDFARWEQLGAQLAEIRLRVEQAQLDGAVTRIGDEELMPALRARLAADLATLDEMRAAYVRRIDEATVRAAGGDLAGAGWERAAAARRPVVERLWADFDAARERRVAAYAEAYGDQLAVVADSVEQGWEIDGPAAVATGARFDSLVAVPVIEAAEDLLFQHWQRWGAQAPVSYADRTRARLRQDRLEAARRTWVRTWEADPPVVRRPDPTEVAHALLPADARAGAPPLADGSYVLAVPPDRAVQALDVTATPGAVAATGLRHDGEGQRLGLTWRAPGACYVLEIERVPATTAGGPVLTRDPDGTVRAATRSATADDQCWTITRAEGGWVLEASGHVLVRPATLTVGTEPASASPPDRALWRLDALDQDRWAPVEHQLQPVADASTALGVRTGAAGEPAVATVRGFGPGHGWRPVYDPAHHAYVLVSATRSETALTSPAGAGRRATVEARDGSSRQLWRPVPLGDGVHQLVSVAQPGLALGRDVVVERRLQPGDPRSVPLPGQDQASARFRLVPGLTTDIPGGGTTGVLVSAWAPGGVRRHLPGHFGGSLAWDRGTAVRATTATPRSAWRFELDAPRGLYRLTTTGRDGRGMPLAWNGRSPHPDEVFAYQGPVYDDQFWRVEPHADGWHHVLRSHAFPDRVLTLTDLASGRTSLRPEADGVLPTSQLWLLELELPR